MLLFLSPPWSSSSVLDHRSLPPCSNPGVDISEGCFILDFAPFSLLCAHKWLQNLNHHQYFPLSKFGGHVWLFSPHIINLFFPLSASLVQRCDYPVNLGGGGDRYVAQQQLPLKLSTCWTWSIFSGQPNPYEITPSHCDIDIRHIAPLYRTTHTDSLPTSRNQWPNNTIFSQMMDVDQNLEDWLGMNEFNKLIIIYKIYSFNQHQITGTINHKSPVRDNKFSIYIVQFSN